MQVNARCDKSGWRAHLEVAISSSHPILHDNGHRRGFPSAKGRRQLVLSQAFQPHSMFARRGDPEAARCLSCARCARFSALARFSRFSRSTRSASLAKLVSRHVPRPTGPFLHAMPPRGRRRCEVQPVVPSVSCFRPRRTRTSGRHSAGACRAKGRTMSSYVQRMSVLPDTGFLRQPQVLLFIPFSKSTLWRRVEAGSFPAPVKLSSKVTAWRAEDLRVWIAAQTETMEPWRPAPASVPVRPTAAARAQAVRPDRASRPNQTESAGGSGGSALGGADQRRGNGPRNLR
ncbi:helix-turn-helix transcriptional regulator [Roseateles chitinivorans]|uniref:helix-turn-helix transcriptional regulator n=1 Tax=Roseateles chitinivorans TaxID=2917965 RepID=UPI003D66A0D5